MSTLSQDFHLFPAPFDNFLPCLEYYSIQISKYLTFYLFFSLKNHVKIAFPLYMSFQPNTVRTSVISIKLSVWHEPQVSIKSLCVRRNLFLIISPQLRVSVISLRQRRNITSTKLKYHFALAKYHCLLADTITSTKLKYHSVADRISLKKGTLFRSLF